MKVLTVKNPWADWIIFGHMGNIKTTENRTWETPYRGRLYIHVSKTFDKYPLKNHFSDLGADIERWEKQQGHIIGFVELYDIDRDIKTEWDEEGLFHWRFKNPIPLEKAIPARGALGLWEYTKTGGKEVGK
jgi:hypothetical protein